MTPNNLTGNANLQERNQNELIGILSNISLNSSGINAQNYQVSKEINSNKPKLSKNQTTAANERQVSFAVPSNNQFKARQVPKSLYERPQEEHKLKEVKAQKQQIQFNEFNLRTDHRVTQRNVQIYIEYMF